MKKEIEQSRLASYKDAPWADENIVHEGLNVVIYKDGYPVTEGHLLFVPKKVECRRDITRCFEIAYEWGVQGVMDYKWTSFNIGINNGVEAGQSVVLCGSVAPDELPCDVAVDGELLLEWGGEQLQHLNSDGELEVRNGEVSA